MQANKPQFYPFHPFYEFESYHSMFPQFQPQINYNSFQLSYQHNERQPSQFMPSSTINHNPSADSRLTQSRNIRAKINRIPLQASKFRKDGQKRQMIKQKQGRNANSNLLRMFFRRLLNNIQVNHEDIKKVIQKYQMKITPKQFIEWLQAKKVDYRIYIRVPTIKKLFIEQNLASQHRKIMRILLKNFITRQSINCYLTSRKVNRQIMSHNYHSLRSIFNDIYAVKA